MTVSDKRIFSFGLLAEPRSDYGTAGKLQMRNAKEINATAETQRRRDIYEQAVVKANGFQRGASKHLFDVATVARHLTISASASFSRTALRRPSLWHEVRRFIPFRPWFNSRRMSLTPGSEDNGFLTPVSSGGESPQPPAEGRPPFIPRAASDRQTSPLRSMAAMTRVKW